MSVNEEFAHALSDLTLDPSDLIDGAAGLQHTMSESHGLSELGGSFPVIPVPSCSCCCCP